jgi:hypothetical protein
MQQDTDLARLFGSAALPLALVAQWTGTTTVNAGSIHHAQASTRLSTLFMGMKLLVRWTVERPVWLEREALAREATSLPG